MNIFKIITNKYKAAYEKPELSAKSAYVLSVLNKQAKDENTNNIPKSAKSGFMFVILWTVKSLSKKVFKRADNIKHKRSKDSLKKTT